MEEEYVLSECARALIRAEADLATALDNQHKYMRENIALASKLNKATDALKCIAGGTSGAWADAADALEDIGQ